MKLSLPTTLFFTSALLLPLFFPPQTHAADLSQAMLRLDRLNPNTSLSGLICATPSAAGAGTEGRVSITFPTTFSLSTTTTNWTTDTADLPSGATPWPGISNTAQSVSGKTVTFSGNDLTSNAANYCFTFSAVSSTTGSAGENTGTLTTKTAGGTMIDSRDFGLTITNDQIRVTAVVGAQPTDFTATLINSSGGTKFGQNSEIEYQLSYSSLLPYVATSVSLEATWSLGTISGSGTPTVEVLNYVSGSATNAYNSTPPVIDLLNRKITWTIGTLPAGAHGTVRFRLKTTDAYRGSSLVNFDVSGRLLGLSTATSYSTVSAVYLFNYSPPGPPGPTATPGPATPTPTTTPTLTKFLLQNVDIRTITADMAQFAVLLSAQGKITLQYGRSPDEMDQELTALNRTKSHLLTLTQLTEATPYYFRITATDSLGRRIVSDIYTFTTARKSELLKITTDTFIATSNKNLIFTFLDRGATGGLNFIIVPTETIFETQFAFPDQVQIKTMQLLTRDRNVLGINNFIEEAEATNTSTTLLEVKPGVFTGRLTSSTQPGNYDIYARVEDYSGNLTEEKIAVLKVSRPFMVFSKNTDRPVENAKVVLYRFNEKNKTYEYVSPQMLPIPNPSYASAAGRVPLVLPIGTYRAEISHPFHEKQSVDFTIGPETGQDYPTILLTPAPFSILRMLDYLTGILVDISASLQSNLEGLLASRRLFDLLALFSLMSFLALSLLALSEKMHVRPRHLPSYFRSLLRTHRHDPEKEHAFRGLISDGHEKNPVADVSIFVTDTETGQVVFHTKSNSQGKFRILLPAKASYAVTLEKISYHPVMLPLTILAHDEEQQFAILKHESLTDIRSQALLFFRSLLGMSFEVLLLICLILTGLLITSFGLLPVLPFFAIAGFNLVFWMLHHLHMHA